MRVRRCTTGTRRTPQFSTTVEIHGFADVTPNGLYVRHHLPQYFLNGMGHPQKSHKTDKRPTPHVPGDPGDNGRRTNGRPPHPRKRGGGSRGQYFAQALGTVIDDLATNPLAPLLTYVSDPCSFRQWRADEFDSLGRGECARGHRLRCAKEQPHHGQDHGFPHPLQPAQWAAC